MNVRMAEQRRQVLWYGQCHQKGLMLDNKVWAILSFVNIISGSYIGYDQ